MSLLDLKSDLSKYRWKGPGAPVDPSSKTPRATSYGDNFGSFQPISNTFIKSGNLPKVVQPKEVDLIGKLDDTRLDNIVTDMRESQLVQRLENTRLDDIQKPQNRNILINAVSSLSPQAKDDVTNQFNRITTEDVTSELAKINQDISQTNITKSDVVVLKSTTAGENNTRSNVDIIKSDNQRGNVRDPNVVINRTPLFINREAQSAVIIKDLRTTTDNITDPGTPVNKVVQTVDRQNQSPSINTYNDLNGSIVNLETNNLVDDTQFDIVGTPLRYNTDSKLVLKQRATIDTTRYDQVSDILGAPSNLNLDDVSETNPSGRHNTDRNTELSNKNGQEIDFFPNTNAEGFTNKVQSGVTEYDLDSSVLGFDGVTEANYFDITNRFTTEGFHAFAQTREDTKFKDGASEFDWDKNVPLSDYFDTNRTYTRSGFHSFAQTGEATKYKVESSIFDWDGVRTQSPSVNYFDLTNRYTTDGFHNFAVEYDTKYIVGSSRFDWDGLRGSAPSTNYFDVANISTFRGFHNFAITKEPTSYQTRLLGSSLVLTDNASLLDWDGLTVPTVNFFDLTNRSTFRGFHAFATTREATSYQTSLIGSSLVLTNNASFLDWDGTVNNVPTVNFFDQNNLRTFRGFHSFATTLEPTSYQNVRVGTAFTLRTNATVFDWNGVRVNAPAVNFFDQNNIRTFRGFHTFAQTLEPTSYQTNAIGTTLALRPNATVFDWNGIRVNAPAVNFFDLTNLHTFRGFHTFSTTLEPTSYIQGASFLDWDGLRAAAPAVDFFPSYAVPRGFHTFAREYDTSYRNIQLGLTSVLDPFASFLDWDSPFLINTPQQPGAPAVNFFDLTNRSTTRGFHLFAQTGEPTSYRIQRLGQGGFGLDPNASFLDWTGGRQNAPTVNYFANWPAGPTTRGFHALAQQAEPTSFATVQSGNVIALRANTSRFDWNGSSTFAPAVDFFPSYAVPRGFHTFARTFDTSYRTTQVGLTSVLDPFASAFDWDSPFLVNTAQQPGAPAVNFFDLANRSTTRGFHTFSQTGEPTSYQTRRLQGGGFGLTDNASFLDWNGGRQNAPTVNFFDPNNINTLAGFHSFATTRQNTRYNTGTIGNNLLAPGATTFDWNGLRNNAPAVNFFDLNNVSTTRGFHTFADLSGGTTAYRLAVGFNPVLGGSANFLAPGATNFDWDGLDPYSIRTTNFFGFTNTTRFGFMVNMSQFDGTAYPIINPRFNANILRIQGVGQRAQRFGLTTFRQLLQPLQTSNLEQFAPATFGGKTISGFRSTLDIQTPAVILQKFNLNVATNRVRTNPTAPGFTKRYTSGGGVDIRPSTVDGTIESWANSNSLPLQVPFAGNQSDTLIERLQKKYRLRDEAYNTDIFGLRQPFVDDSLHGPESVSMFPFDDGLVRGGIVNNTISALLDSVRIGKFLLSGRGILFNIKQSGLQAMNPNVDKPTANNPIDSFLNLPSIISTKAPSQFYNPLSIPRNVLEVGPLGNRYARHGIMMDGVFGRYERVAIDRALNSDKYSYFDEFSDSADNNYNRLIGLVKELLPNSYDPIRQNTLPKQNTQLEINRISSSHGGPGSLLGFFGTTINRATHPFKIVNSTNYIPEQVNVTLGLDREVFFSARYDSGNRQTDTYSEMLLRQIEKYDGDMHGLILDAAMLSITQVSPSPRNASTTADSQLYTPSFSDSRKNKINSADSKIQLITRQRIGASKVFDFKKPTTTERFKAINGGYIPYRDKNESIFDEIFFVGSKNKKTYYDRLFGETDGESTKYGNAYGVMLGSTVGIVSSGLLPKFVDGRQVIDKTEFKVPLNKYDKRRIEELDVFGFKQIPIKERGRRVISENITPRKDLLDLASETFFTSNLIRSDVNLISRFSYGDYLLGRLPDGETQQVVLNPQDQNEFSLGILGSLALNQKLEGIHRKFEGDVVITAEYNKIPINDKTKTLIEKLKPFEFIPPTVNSRYKAVTSENAYREGENLYSEMYFGSAKSKYDVLVGKTVDKLSYGAKLKDDWATKNSRVYGLVLAAATLNLRKTASSPRNASTIIVGGPTWDSYVNGNFDGTAANEAYPLSEVAINSETVQTLKSLKTFDFKYPNPYERFSALSALGENFREGNRSLSNGPDIDESSKNINPLLKYKTTRYSQLGETRSSNAWWSASQPTDFRDKIIDGTEYFSTDPRVVDYKKYGVELRGDGTGFGDPGLPGYRKNLPYISNIHYTSGLSRKAADNYAFATGSDGKLINAQANRKYGAYPNTKPEILKREQAERENGNPTATFFRGDRINIIDWKRSEQNINVNNVYEKTSPYGNQMLGSQDLIQFYFSGVDLIASENKPTEAIVFRAYIDTILDNHKPTWTPIKYIGRADPVYSYDSYEREISFGFTVHTGTRDELKATWRKLNMLASWTTPDYVDPGFMKAPICRLNIGNLYRKFPGFISSLTYTFDNTMTTWETAKLAEDLNISDRNIGPLSKPGALELPKTILVQCTFVTFNIYRPQWDCVFYSLFDDTTGGTSVETGLVPRSDDRVNYFRTHDDLPVTHPMNALLCAVIPPPPPPPVPKKRTVTAGGPGGGLTTPPPTTPPPTTPPPTTAPPNLPEKICICKIDFCFDEDREITPESRRAVIQVANWLNECPNIRVNVKAYCSREADNFAYNKLLSMARAVTVCNLLIEECGIASNRLVPVGMGFGDYKEAYKPESKSRWAKQQNRRVIFEIIEGADSCNYKPSFDCNPELPECDKSEYCYRKDGTKFWRVGPHYFTGNRFIEEGGKSVGETYTGWPKSTGPIRPPGLSIGAFNSKTKLELPFAADLTKRLAWHKSYRIQNPDETQGVAQQTYNVWFDPLLDAKQHFQLEGTSEKPVITISGGDTPIDIWIRRNRRDTNIKNSKGKQTHVNTGFSGKKKGEDGLDNVTYIINPNK